MAREACDGTQQPKTPRAQALRRPARGRNSPDTKSASAHDDDGATTTPEPINHSLDALVVPRLSSARIRNALVASV